MYQQPAIPRSIGGVLDDSLQLYKSAFASCLAPSLLVSVLTAAFTFFIFNSISSLAQPASPASSLAVMRAMSGELAIWYVIFLAISLIFYGMLVVNVTAVARGEKPAFGASIAKATRRAPLLFVGSVCFVIAIVVGFCLLIIPGFYLWNRLQLFVLPLVDESEGPFTSFGKSWQVVGGNWWRTATVVTVMFVLLIVLEVVITTIGGFIAGVTGFGMGAGATSAQILMRVQVITGVIGAFARVFTAPLIIAVYVVLYKDLILRKGGADLEARLGALPQG